MANYTDIARVPGAWRDASIASAASNALNTHGYYNPSVHGPNSSIPSNASGSVNVTVSSHTSSAYDSLAAEGQRISRALANGTASRAEVESYNARAREFAAKNPAPK